MPTTTSSSSPSSATRKREMALDIMLNEAIVNNKKSAIRVIRGMNGVSRADWSRFTALKKENPKAVHAIGYDLTPEVLTKNAKNPHHLPARFGLLKRHIRYGRSLETNKFYVVKNHPSAATYKIPSNEIDWYSDTQFKVTDNLVLHVFKMGGHEFDIQYSYRIRGRSMICDSNRIVLKEMKWSDVDLESIVRVLHTMNSVTKRNTYFHRYVIRHLKKDKKLSLRIAKVHKLLEPDDKVSFNADDFIYARGPSEKMVPFEKLVGTPSSRTSTVSDSY